MGKKVYWHLMNWQELRDISAQNPTILVPAGTTETQGPSSYVGFEFVLPQRLGEEIAKRTNALVAPTIPFGYSPDFMDFPGTIMLQPGVITDVYEGVVRSILRHGFDHIMFLVTHTPNQPMIEEVAYKIREEFGILIAWINPGKLASTYLKDVSPNFEAAKGHGADPVLSLGKFLEPEMIDLSNVVSNEFESDYQGINFAGGSTLSFQDYPFNVPIKLQDMSPDTGGFGDTSYASEEQGAQIFTQMVEYLVALVDRFSKMDTRISA